MVKISALIIAFNEEYHIGECIDSVAFADEIIVVDSYSTDHTAEIVKEKGATHILHKWEGFAKQREFGIRMCNGEWIIMVDADERITDELKNVILKITDDKNSADGYEIPRRNFAFGKEMKHMWPARTLRLFRKDKAKITLEREIHEKVIIDGKVEKLDEPMIHYTYDNIEQYLTKMNNYTTLLAKQYIKNNSEIDTKKHFRKALFSFFHKFLDKYISRGGFRDGVYGFYLSILNGIAAMSMELKIIDIWRKENE